MRSGAQRHVGVVATGGTIASLLGADGAVAALSGAEVLARAGCSAAVVGPVVEVAKVNSSDMTPELMLEVARACRRLSAREDVDGVVVLHGTDTVEETAFVCDLTLEVAGPVVFTGAMRPAGAPGDDGPENVRRAVALALDPHARDLGVLVSFGDRVLPARWLRKTDSSGLDPFVAPAPGVAGELDGRGRPLPWAHAGRATVPLPRTSRLPRVALLTAYTGMPADAAVRAVTDTGAAGLVVEGFGAGNVPAALGPSLAELVASGVLVAVATRVPHGGAHPAYGGPGGHAGLVAAGVLSSPLLTAAKTRLLLQLCLAVEGEDPRSLFEQARTVLTPLNQEVR